MTTEVYTQEQQHFIQKMRVNIPEVEEYWEDNQKEWDNLVTFYTELHPFIVLIENTFLIHDMILAQKILNNIENFLQISSSESKKAIAFFFVEDLINWLEHESDKHVQKFVNLLGPESKKCCKEVDRFWRVRTPGLW